MNASRRPPLARVAALALLAGCLPLASAPAQDRGAENPCGAPKYSYEEEYGLFGSNGQRIYVLTESDSGQLITYEWSGKPVYLSCALCHGGDGRGTAFELDGERIEGPDITFASLRTAAPPYTLEGLKRAISAGVDPAGNPLSGQMPRWRMSAADLDDLICFIRNQP